MSKETKQPASNQAPADDPFAHLFPGVDEQEQERRCDAITLSVMCRLLAGDNITAAYYHKEGNPPRIYLSANILRDVQADESYYVERLNVLQGVARNIECNGEQASHIDQLVSPPLMYTIFENALANQEYISLINGTEASTALKGFADDLEETDSRVKLIAEYRTSLANFSGIDRNALKKNNPEQLQKLVTDLLARSKAIYETRDIPDDIKKLTPYYHVRNDLNIFINGLMESPELRQTLISRNNQFVDNPQKLHAETNLVPIARGLGGEGAIISTSRRCCKQCYHLTQEVGLQVIGTHNKVYKGWQYPKVDSSNITSQWAVVRNSRNQQQWREVSGLLSKQLEKEIRALTTTGTAPDAFAVPTIPDIDTSKFQRSAQQKAIEQRHEQNLQLANDKRDAQLEAFAGEKGEIETAFKKDVKKTTTLAEALSSLQLNVQTQIQRAQETPVLQSNLRNLNKKLSLLNQYEKILTEEARIKSEYEQTVAAEQQIYHSELQHLGYTVTSMSSQPQTHESPLSSPLLAPEPSESVRSQRMQQIELEYQGRVAILEQHQDKVTQEHNTSLAELTQSYQTNLSPFLTRKTKLESQLKRNGLTQAEVDNIQETIATNSLEKIEALQSELTALQKQKSKTKELHDQIKSKEAAKSLLLAKRRILDLQLSILKELASVNQAIQTLEQGHADAKVQLESSHAQRLEDIGKQKEDLASPAHEFKTTPNPLLSSSSRTSLSPANSVPNLTNVTTTTTTVSVAPATVGTSPSPSSPFSQTVAAEASQLGQSARESITTLSSRSSTVTTTTTSTTPAKGKGGKRGTGGRG